MATDAQLQANRANAKKSCGPKSDDGKARSPAQRPQARPARQDRRSRPAARRPRRAGSQDPGVDRRLPADQRHRARAGRPGRADLLDPRPGRAARDRPARSKQVRKAMLRSRAKRTEKVCDLGRKLFYMAGKRLLPTSGPAWSDDPSAFVARLEEIARRGAVAARPLGRDPLPDHLERELDVPRPVQIRPAAGQAAARRDRRSRAERGLPGLGDDRGRSGARGSGTRCKS